MIIPAQSERGFEVCYRPLAVGESKELLRWVWKPSEFINMNYYNNLYIEAKSWLW